MMDFWVRFARSGHPGGGWRAVRGVGDESLEILDVPVTRAAGRHIEACEIIRPF